MKFNGWVKLVLREEFEVEADSYTEALDKIRDVGGEVASIDFPLEVVGREFGVTPLSMKEGSSD